MLQPSVTTCSPTLGTLAPSLVGTAGAPEPTTDLHGPFAAAFAGKSDPVCRYSPEFLDRLDAPRAGGRKGTQQVQVAVVGTHLVEAVIRAVPLLDNLLHHVVAVADPEADRALVRLSAGVALDLHDQSGSIIRVHRKAS